MSMRSRLVVAVVAGGVLAVGAVGAASFTADGPSPSAPEVQVASGASSPGDSSTPTTEPQPPQSSEPVGAASSPASGDRRATTDRPGAQRVRPSESERRQRRAGTRIEWRESQALGPPQDGRLVDGVLLPSQGEHFFTWDRVRDTSPNPRSRRWGTDHLIRTLLQVLEEYSAAHPEAPRVAIGDLSHREGGEIEGHVSHENGLDIDLYYPRRDGREQAPSSVDEVDLVLAQDLVDGFVRAGAQFVFVGPSTGLEGPPDVVQPLPRHDHHLHVRLYNPDASTPGADS